MRIHPKRATCSILCVHGVGHGDTDAALAPAWTGAITAALRRWNPDVHLDFEFLRYDDLFDTAALDPGVYATALGRLLSSGLSYGLTDLFGSTRGLLGVPEQVRWTAGMIAQWASQPRLRVALRRRILATLGRRPFSGLVAHSLGSLLCYDALSRSPGGSERLTFISCGSQIGSPFVRECFAGRVEPLAVRQWYHLFNADDRVLTAPVKVTAPNFVAVRTDFATPDALNHDPLFYFDHPNTHARVWSDFAGGASSSRVTRRVAAARHMVEGPRRRALLIGIDEYANSANGLEGCVNDVFLMSAALQDCGFQATDVRVVVNGRATTQHLLDRLHWLLDDVPAGGERVLCYSGHGAQLPTYDVGGEVDHLDECLVPYDFDWSPERAIRDKQFVEFYSQLRYDCSFVAVFDCCHSGGLTRDGGLRARGLSPPDDIRHRMMAWQDARWQPRGLTATNRSLDAGYAGRDGDNHRLGRAVGLRTMPNRRYDAERTALGHHGAYMPVILEACGEQQLAYEHRDGTTSYGAFTFAMTQALRDARHAGANPTFRGLMALTRARLKALGYHRQVPQSAGPSRLIGRPVPWLPVKASKARAGRRPQT